MATMSAARIRSLCRRHNHAHEAVYHFSAKSKWHGSSHSLHRQDAELVLRPYYESRLRQLVGEWRDGGSGPDTWVEFRHDPVAGVIDVVTRESIDLLVLSVHPSTP